MQTAGSECVQHALTETARIVTVAINTLDNLQHFYFLFDLFNSFRTCYYHSKESLLGSIDSLVQRRNYRVLKSNFTY